MVLYPSLVCDKLVKHSVRDSGHGFVSQFGLYNYIFSLPVIFKSLANECSGRFRGLFVGINI
jgi:hypothetical protein